MLPAATLDWLTSTAVAKSTRRIYTILRKPKKFFDHDHYGMDEVKKRILEFIVVAKLKGLLQGRFYVLSGLQVLENLNR